MVGTSTVASTYLDDGRVAGVKVDGNVVAVSSYNATTAEVTGVAYPTGTGDAGNGGSLASVTRDPQGRETSTGWTLPGSHTVGEPSRV